MSNLTANEITVLRITINYDNRKSQKSDNFSNFDVETAMEELNMNAKQIGGVLSSLIQKGFLDYDDESDMHWLNDNKIDETFDALGLA